MVSFKSWALASILSVQALAFDLPMENCDVPDYAHITGGGASEDGEDFCASKFKEGILIKSIEVQGDHEMIRGLLVTWSDNSYEEFGTMDVDDQDRYAKIEFDATADVVQKAEVWENGHNARTNKAAGGLIFALSNGARLDIRADNADDADSTKLDIGESGMLLGIKGRAGASIDRLDFIFANKKVKKRSVENLELQPSIDEINARLSNDERGFTVEFLDEVHHVNNLDTETTIWLRGEKKVSVTTSISQSDSSTFHFGMGFEFKSKIGVPFFGESELTLKSDVFWEETSTLTNTQSETEEVVKAWQQIANAPPCTALRCYAWTFEGSSIDVSWKGLTRITFEDDTYMEWESEGGYNTAQYSRVNTVCDKEPIEDAQAALKSGAKVYEDGKRLTHGSKQGARFMAKTSL